MCGAARQRRRGGTTTRRDGTHAPGLSLPPARMRLNNHRMNYFPLTTVQHAWQERTAELSAREIGPRAAEVDRKAEFPHASLHALRDAGLWSIRVPQQYGGLGLDLVTTCLIVEEVASSVRRRRCATRCTWRRWRRSARFRPCTSGNAISSRSCTARCSPPPGWGAAWRDGGRLDPRPRQGLRLAARDRRPRDRPCAQIVRDLGGPRHALCHVLSGRGRENRGAAGTRDLQARRGGVETIGVWDGVGMRGNCSVPMIFNGVVPEANLVGIELEDHRVPVMTKYMAPCQILTYGAAYLGIASGAFALACVRRRQALPGWWSAGWTTHSISAAWRK